MHIHILGICGTFMGSLALLAQALGHRVTGSDQNVYPPMSTQLENAGIVLMQGYHASHLQPHPDLVVVGNALTRGVEAVEYMLNANLRYTSGPQFLAEHILVGRTVLAVAGTHGKTTTTTMLAWILHYSGIDTGFLIGGVPQVGSNPLAQKFIYSSYLGQDFFVVEADEYDSAYFDKRSKFIHYRPKIAILNNLEFDHADIFDNLAAIERQFHHLVRTIPSHGTIIAPIDEPNLETVFKMGCYTPCVRTGIARGDVYAMPNAKGFTLYANGQKQGEVAWGMVGVHNIKNALSAIVAAHAIGVQYAKACMALCEFSGIKRRMERVGVAQGVAVYDDFAHHPTAIANTLSAARDLGARQVWALIEPRSNTMRMGVHQNALVDSVKNADHVLWYKGGIDWNVDALATASKGLAFANIETMIDHIATHAQAGDIVVAMSNGSFGGIHRKLVQALNARSGH